VLIVEDEIKMAGLIRRGLREEDLAADVAIKGEDAIWMAQATEYDAIVLDVMLPGIDGFATCRRLREEGVWAPVLMLTARDGVEDRVAGLDGGADDYLTKPFSFAELLARLRALARRGTVERPTVLEVGDLRLDPATRRVWRGDTEIPLSAKEFALLETFMRRPGEVLSRYRLLEHAWDYEYENRLALNRKASSRPSVDVPARAAKARKASAAGSSLYGLCTSSQLRSRSVLSAITRSRPGPQSMISPPLRLAASIRSLPEPPDILFLPDPPSRKSLPEPPERPSPPSPPLSTSFPGPPKSRSFPSPP